MENERDSLKKEITEISEEIPIDTEFLEEFRKREVELKSNLSAEIEKWSKLRTALENTGKNLDEGKAKEKETALKETEELIKSIEQELTEIENKLKEKTTENKSELSKKKKSTAQKLTKVRKKYEKLKKDLKSDKTTPELETELKTELGQIINNIAAMEKEYKNLTKILDLNKNTLYAIFQIIPVGTGAGTDGSLSDIKKQLEESKKHETELKMQLEASLKNIEELKKEIDEMDESYHSEIKNEYERLHKKSEEERQQEFDKRIKEFKKQEILKIENKYKTSLKEQEEKYKKELELAALHVFELEQQISQLKEFSEGILDFEQKTRDDKSLKKVKEEEKAELYAGDEDIIETIPTQRERDLPVRMPKKPGSAGGKSKITYTIEDDEAAGKKEPAKKEKDKKRLKRKKTVSKAQCGACGEYIPIDSTSCPNCGVYFSQPEVELGACGNCGNLIPVSVKECPICGAKFE